jgi:hypothetical protein
MMGLSPGCNPKDPGIAGMFDVTDVKNPKGERERERDRIIVTTGRHRIA